MSGVHVTAACVWLLWRSTTPTPPVGDQYSSFVWFLFVRQLISPLGSFSSHHLRRLSFWGYSKNCSLSSDLSLFSPYLSYHWSLQSPQCTLLTPSTPSATHQSWVNSSNCSPWQRGPQSVTPTAWGITGLLLTLSHLRTSQTKHTIIQQLHTHTHICFVLFFLKNRSQESINEHVVRACL